MSEQLLEYLQASMTGHGLASERDGPAIRVQDGLVIEPRVIPRESVAGTAQVQVDFAVRSPRLGGLPLLDSFAGVAGTQEDAEKNAFSKFLQGSFHVIAEALTAHDYENDQVEWEDWAANGRAWRACTGPLLLIGSRPGARIDGFGEFFPRLTHLFKETMDAGPHWMRVYMGALDGQQLGSEVLVDGNIWQAGQALLADHAFSCPEGFASFRHLVIVLPRGG